MSLRLAVTGLLTCWPADLLFSERRRRGPDGQVFVRGVEIRR